MEQACHKLCGRCGCVACITHTASLIWVEQMAKKVYKIIRSTQWRMRNWFDLWGINHPSFVKPYHHGGQTKSPYRASILFLIFLIISSSQPYKISAKRHMLYSRSPHLRNLTYKASAQISKQKKKLIKLSIIAHLTQVFLCSRYSRQCSRVQLVLSPSWNRLVLLALLCFTNLSRLQDTRITWIFFNKF